MQEFSRDLIPPDDSTIGKDNGIGDLARQCSQLAKEITTVLDKMKSKNPGSKREDLRSSFNVMRYGKKKEELQARLSRCREQLELYWSYETRKDLSALLSSAENTRSKMLLLQKQVEDLQRMNQRFSTESQKWMEGLLDISAGGYDIMLSKYLISSLTFESMNTRLDKVAQAHDDTLQWIFNGNYDDRNCDGFHKSFNTWLSDGDGIFHISGKLGSGKSTLMKLLYRDDRTKKRLIQWADGSELIMAQFFFWNPGSRLQKSMEGLLRSLLYEALKSGPSLVAEVLPQQWHQIKSTPLQAQKGTYFSLDDLFTAFDRLVRVRRQDYRICFFIDGLDEYDNSGNEDYADVVEQLCHWSQSPEGNVKFCVSSREYSVFMNHFPEHQRICMQDLTRVDIKQFILDKMEPFAHCHGLKYLVGMIEEKANGVFLWVSLVMRRLRDLNERGEATRVRLEIEIDNLPERLEDLFKHLLGSIHPADRNRVHQTFAIVQKLKEHDLLHFRLIWYYLIDDILSDLPDERLPSLFARWFNISKRNRLMQARKMLMDSSKGFVEATWHGQWDSHGRDKGKEENWIISFTHRSVPDFLQSYRSQEQEKHLKDFCLENAISRIFLLAIREGDMRLSGCDHVPEIVSYVMEARQRANISKQPFFYEEQLESVLARHGFTDLTGGRVACPVPPGYDNVEVIAILIPHCSSTESVFNPLHTAAFIGNYAYLRWKVKRDPSCIKVPLNIAIITYCHYRNLLQGTTRDSIFGDDGLSYHALTVQSSISPPLLKGLSVSNRCEELALWQHLALGLMVGFQYESHDPCSSGVGLFW
ncbi:hypothetical protein P170DRAFT_346100 [Aspergillus steynii IBT 23096]|uniref:Nephrocystin 3-like N-terminal domain-containing protein n=1 Tax=Aspergillus steynii IBT 23096 TaxID=1392250 RepID=A0A2I2GLU8_9EURO|nr:uncharacterized protein P170DRAFT_346100 [Aspergillus steynii IBT 23096]PLB53850.1 hypothetical protein P170DRAFT_346100 [Aspergillus steynii IBT 23096]